MPFSVDGDNQIMHDLGGFSLTEPDMKGLVAKADPSFEKRKTWRTKASPTRTLPHADPLVHGISLEQAAAIARGKHLTLNSPTCRSCRD